MTPTRGGRMIALETVQGSYGGAAPTPQPKLTIQSGDGQSADVGSQYAAPLEVVCWDNTNARAVGIVVTLVPLNGGSSDTPDTSDGVGVASFLATATATPGPDLYKATATINATPVEITFAMTSVEIPAGLTELRILAGDAQSAIEGGNPYSDLLQFRAFDNLGLPKSGVVVTLEALDGGGVAQEDPEVIPPAPGGAFVDDNFETGDLHDYTGETPGDFLWGGALNRATNEQAKDGAYSLKFGGNVGGSVNCGNWNNEQYFYLTNQFTELWLDYDIYFPADYWRAIQSNAINGEGAATGSVSAASTTFTISAGSFNDFDIGKYITITGAGVAGADLETAVASRTSPTEVELVHAASTTVSGALWDRSCTQFGNWKFFTLYGEEYGGVDRPRVILSLNPSQTVAGQTVLQYSLIENGTRVHASDQQYMHSSDPTDWAHHSSGVDIREMVVDTPTEGYFTKGGWTRFRVYVNLGTQAGPGDGVFKVWIGDTLVTNFTDVSFYPEDEDATPGTHYPYFDTGYLFGAANAGSPFEYTNYIDNFTIHASDPGW